MAGATAPSTLAGSLTMANSEVLAGIVLAKAVNDAAPVIYASWARTLDMKYGNVTLGAPEFAMLRTAATQMAKMYGLPCGGGGLLTDSKLSTMGKTIQALVEAGIRDRVKVLLGGAPVTQAFADSIGADGYASDGATAAVCARRLAGRS
jgi:trimethylamine:corrinoid methyltransferase-like protein